MFGFAKKYSQEEEQLLNWFKSSLEATGIPSSMISFQAKLLLNEAIKQAKELGLYENWDVVKNRLNDPAYLKKRTEAGLTKSDVETFVNINPVVIIAGDNLTNFIRLAIFSSQKEKGLTADEITKKLRKSYIYYGDPENSHQNYQEENADIYQEFSTRYEQWRNTISLEQENSIAEQYSTYNAMVRDLIRKGNI